MASITFGCAAAALSEKKRMAPNGGGIGRRQCGEVVLPVRIELTTSALPRMRSTTELRQHFVRKGAPMAAAPAPVNPPLRLCSGHACGQEACAPCGAHAGQRQ